MQNLSPLQGPPNTLFERIKQYIEPFDAEWTTQCQPATAEMIDEYAKLNTFQSKDNVPASFLSFIEHAGREDGGLLKKFNIYANLDAVIEACRTRRKYQSVYGDTFAIAALDGLGEPICFDLRAGKTEPQIVHSDNDEEAEALAHSWEYLIMRAAMLKRELKRLPFGYWTSSTAKRTSQALLRDGSISIINVFDKLAEKHQLELAWPGDDYYRIAISNNFSVLADLNRSGAVLMYLFASEEVMLNIIGSEFEQALGCYGGKKFSP